MKSRIVLVALASVVGVLMSTPAHIDAQQNSTAGHEHNQPATTAAQATPAPMASGMEMMARMRADQQKLDELVKTMNEAKGTEKTDAIAALLTALVQDRKTMHESMMSNMPGMMNMMGGGHAGGEMKPQPKK